MTKLVFAAVAGYIAANMSFSPEYLRIALDSASTFNPSLGQIIALAGPAAVVYAVRTITRCSIEHHKIDKGIAKV